MNFGFVGGSAGQPQRSSREPTRRLMYRPMCRFGPLEGMAMVPHGMKNSADQPRSVSWLTPYHGPSQLLEYCRSGRIVPSLCELPSATLNQNP